MTEQHILPHRMVCNGSCRNDNNLKVRFNKYIQKEFSNIINCYKSAKLVLLD